MLPMNKICEDIKEYIKKNDTEEKVVVKTEATKKDELVLFANDLTEKYGEHVDIKLVKSLMVNIQDSTVKDESNAI
jgi:predicted RNase H-related nuclease YkuK (DUF458 family)